jgi:hypothetical protein
MGRRVLVWLGCHIIGSELRDFQTGPYNRSASIVGRCEMSELAFCGDNCSSCPRHSRNLDGDAERAGRVAELWYRCGWTDTIACSEEIAEES